MPQAPNDRLAVSFALMAVALWSTVATAFKISLQYLDVPQLLLVATVTATVCLYGVLVSRGMGALPWRQPGQVWQRALGLGLLTPLAYYLILFQAYALLPAQVAQTLNYTWAIALMLLSVPFLGHRLRARDLLAAGICYAGAALICLGGSSITGDLSRTGIALALGSTLIWAGYWIGKTRDPLDPVLSLFLSFLCACPFVAGAWWWLSGRTVFSWPGIAGGIYVGLFEMGITFVLWLMALRLASSPARVSTLIYVAPFLSLWFIHIALGEAIARTTLMGLGLIISGLLLQQQGRSGHPVLPRHSPPPGGRRSGHPVLGFGVPRRSPRPVGRRDPDGGRAP
ncbi:MAG: DMT family transporter [Gammaproteobacteria bacterium]|nr:DMT family transporter [Gammaproteobacteria bacterium]